jgi:UDP-glucose 4-epimerase
VSEDGATPRRALVTGGAGFIGSHLVEELLRRGAEVVVVDDLSTGHASNLAAVAQRVRVERFDVGGSSLRELLARERFDAVFHLVGHADVPASVRDPLWDLERNGLSTFRALEAVRATQPDARFLFASSAAVYGEAADRPLREGDPTHPVAPYGVSKLMAERYVAVHAAVYGMRTASLRLFPIYGPRCRKHVVHDLIAKVQADPRTLSIHGDGSQVRDFTHVSDAVEAFLRVASAASLAGETYNVASGEALSIRRLAELVCEAAGLDPRFEFTQAMGAGVSHRWTADVARLRALGWGPRTAMPAGLADTVRWFRAERAREPRA